MLISREAIKADAKQAIREARPSVFLVTLVYLFIGFILEYLTMKVTKEYGRIMEMLQAVTEGNPYFFPASPNTSLMADIISVALSIMTMMMGVGFTIYTLNVSRRVSAGYGNLFDGFAIFFKALWLHILMWVFVFLWSLLFIIPGIVASYRYRQALYIMLDNPDMSALECIRASKRMMMGRKWELFVLDLSFFGWTLLSIIPFVILWTLPYTEVTYANYYQALVHMPGGAGFNNGWPGNQERENDGYRDPWQ
ncbi:MAG: DUF975 family protein [Oscillospiraceae bacterium]